MIEVKNLYDKNKDFKRYVDAIAKKQNIPVEDVLEFTIVRSKAKDVKERMESR